MSRWCRAHDPVGPRYWVALRDAQGGDGGEEFVRFVKADEIKPAHNRASAAQAARKTGGRG